MTYQIGYSGGVKTLAELETSVMWSQIDPELRRRLLALMDASNAAGRPVGIGGAYRSTERQTALFLERYRKDVNGTIFWNGQRWSKKPGVASAAPPGRSYHEPTTAAGKCLAADLIGDLSFVAEVCAVYGLREFSKVNGEPWHVQPVEIPGARSQYNPAKHEPLPRFPLPGTTTPPTPGDDLMTVIYAPKGCYARFVATADRNGVAVSCRWLRTNDETAAYTAVGAVVKVCEVVDLAPLFLLGSLPTGDPGHQWSAADFAGVAA